MVVGAGPAAANEPSPPPTSHVYAYDGAAPVAHGTAERPSLATALPDPARGGSRAARENSARFRGFGVAAKAGDDAALSITKPYARPGGATTAEQRASVQGRPCVDCGATAETQVADHIDPLVKEYYRTGSIDLGRMRSLDAVQPQCPACSASQGGTLSWFSRAMRDFWGLG